MRHWERPHYIVANRFWRLSLWVFFFVYLVVGIGSIEINWIRIYEGLERGSHFLSAFLHPDFTTRSTDIYAGILESLTITVTSTVAGILLSIPFGIGAARNISIKPIYLFCRAFIAISRSMQEVIVAIFLVALFGFGAFAGFLTLTYATIGFLGKLLAEEIEGIDRKQLEAVRSTGASWLQSIHVGIWPQIMPRMIGLSFYRLDINFRESAVIGIVGAGGIGATLNTAIDRYEYDSAGAILLLIIIIVMICEYLSGWIRKWIS
ncbi:phosphonate ABC transporter, permease protein PhnE [Psychromonas sp. 14N.309.X.WAT.B.A12]|jgi:phosphonate transport system permease protein|uniref:phosphonate ABC transporter, permease protein PhnE n=1 Tax=unclassified Psychromonas TaxID=2614957 RepID=UPI0025AF3767|nr:phosphonate ABC transporter, permease protein PhnE [Psychromonas sp. 14N.309.X.WAT.B.A12]MDN2664943.1 phosphonate ABC transporter, permease protein PhnE [Psychromonas sp. 14N.309.X.WAT.B.A12]